MLKSSSFRSSFRSTVLLECCLVKAIRWREKMPRNSHTRSSWKCSAKAPRCKAEGHMSIRNNNIMCVCTIWRIHCYCLRFHFMACLFTWKIPQLLPRLKWVAIVCAHQLLNAVFFFTSKCLWNSAKTTNSSTAFHSHLSSSSHSSISCHHPSTSEFSPPESQRKMKRNTNTPYVPSLTCINEIPVSHRPLSAWHIDITRYSAEFIYAGKLLSYAGLKDEKTQTPWFPCVTDVFCHIWVLGLEAEYWIWSRDFIISGNGQWIFWNETSGIINIQFLLKKKCIRKKYRTLL